MSIHKGVRDRSVFGTPSFSMTPTTIEMILPVPPSINHQYATVKGRRVLSSTGRAYKTCVAQQILTALAVSPYRTIFVTNVQRYALSLSLTFYFTSRLRRDIDGGLKIAQDAMCNALGINDNRILEIHLYKSTDPASPRMVCTLSTTSLLIPPRNQKKSVSSDDLRMVRRRRSSPPRISLGAAEASLRKMTKG